LTDAELAICCASHTGADYHVKEIQSVLSKIGLGEVALKCGGHLPEDRGMRERLIRLEANPTAIYNNCSGKHAGMLAACVASDWPVDTYLEEGHPLQQRILQLVADYSGLSEEKIGLGIDGCSLPTYFMPLSALALMAARFIARAGDPWTPLPEGSEGTPDRRLLEAINRHPEMIQSEEGFDAVLIRSIDELCYAKRGAMGVMIVGLYTREHGPIGICLKTEDGDNRVIPVIVTNLLEHLNLLSPEEKSRLSRYKSEPVKNWAGTVVGEVKSEFRI
jgi:L-asparaginase II